jgi:formate transporter FocA
MTEFDALLPVEMAKKAEDIGEKKANMSFSKTALLAILAGIFISIGGIFATTVQAGGQDIPFGMMKIVAGLAFCVGLTLVVIGGAELFTSNNLLVFALFSKKIRLSKFLRNLVIVYTGNFVGSIILVLLIFYSKQYTFAHGGIGEVVLKTANAKCGIGFVEAILLGILCNIFVCLAVWLTYSARSVTDKIISFILPITAFVAAGFEHSVANMYVLPLGWLIKAGAPAQFWADIGKTSADYAAINWSNILVGNLLPVTIGNFIGGAMFVGVLYWIVYRKLAN